jgi:hypothetical protein
MHIDKDDKMISNFTLDVVSRSVCMHNTHLLHSKAILCYLELKTRPLQLLSCFVLTAEYIYLYV